MKKYLIYFLLVSILIFPGFSFAQTKFLTEEEQETQEQIENIEKTQGGEPEGAGVVLGEEDLDLEKPKNLPGEFSYSFQRFWENIVSVFTFRKENKVEYSMMLAEKRLAELNLLLGREKWQNAKSTITLYKKHIESAARSFENLNQDEAEKISSDLTQDLLRYIAILSIFAEDEDYKKVKSNLNSALEVTLEFQRDIGL